MVTENDNQLDGLTYERALFIVCEEDTARYLEAYTKCWDILQTIPLGWTDK
jgi:hypothetical protein